MQDYLSLGPVPSEEPCAQVGEEQYDLRARAECRRFIALLRATFGPEPSGAWLSSKAFDHDYGTYYEVVCYFNAKVPTSIDYAYRCEREAPTTWGREGERLQQCPVCGGALELGQALSLASYTASDGLLCPRCKVIYAHDRSVLARLV